MTSTPTRPVDNVITKKGLQDRNIHIFDGTTVENKGKLILKDIYEPNSEEQRRQEEILYSSIKNDSTRRGMETEIKKKCRKQIQGLIKDKY